jgi:hypothetical protein
MESNMCFERNPVALQGNYEKPFIADSLINGIPLKVALFFVVIMQARNDGSDWLV